MASARRSRHASREPIALRLYSWADHQPSTTPGTVSAAGPPRGGIAVSMPRAAYHATLAAPAERPVPRSARSAPLRPSWISHTLSPPSPFMCGYTTAMVAAAAMAASRALPPARSAATPEAEASAWGEATMPRVARDSGQRSAPGSGERGEGVDMAGSVPSGAGGPSTEMTSEATRGSALEVLAAATRLGLTSFGGPIAHLGY